MFSTFFVCLFKINQQKHPVKILFQNNISILTDIFVALALLAFSCFSLNIEPPSCFFEKVFLVWPYCSLQFFLSIFCQLVYFNPCVKCGCFLRVLSTTFISYSICCWRISSSFIIFNTIYMVMPSKLYPSLSPQLHFQ